MDLPSSKSIRSFEQAPSVGWEKFARICLDAHRVELSVLRELTRSEMEQTLERHYWDTLLDFIQSRGEFSSVQSVADMIGVDRTTLSRWRQGKTKAHLTHFLAGMVYLAGDVTLETSQTKTLDDILWLTACAAIKKIRSDVCQQTAQSPTRYEIRAVHAFFRHQDSLEAIEDARKMQRVIEDVNWLLIHESNDQELWRREKIKRAIEEWAEPYSLYRLGIPENRRGNVDETV